MGLVGTVPFCLCVKEIGVKLALSEGSIQAVVCGQTQLNKPQHIYCQYDLWQETLFPVTTHK